MLKRYLEYFVANLCHAQTMAIKSVARKFNKLTMWHGFKTWGTFTICMNPIKDGN